MHQRFGLPKLACHLNHLKTAYHLASISSPLGRESCDINKVPVSQPVRIRRIIHVFLCLKSWPKLKGLAKHGRSTKYYVSKLIKPSVFLFLGFLRPEFAVFSALFLNIFSAFRFLFLGVPRGILANRALRCRFLQLRCHIPLFELLQNFFSN